MTAFNELNWVINTVVVAFIGVAIRFLFSSYQGKKDDLAKSYKWHNDVSIRLEKIERLLEPYHEDKLNFKED